MFRHHGLLFLLKPIVLFRDTINNCLKMFPYGHVRGSVKKNLHAQIIHVTCSRVNIVNNEVHTTRPLLFNWEATDPKGLC